MCMRVWSICTCIDLSAAFSSSLAFVRPSILQFGLSGCIQQQLRMPYWPAFVYVGRWWMSCSSLTGSCRRSLSACWSFPASCRLCSSCMLLGFTRAPAVSPAADQCKHMDPSCRSLRQLVSRWSLSLGLWWHFACWCTGRGSELLRPHVQYNHLSPACCWIYPFPSTGNMPWGLACLLGLLVTLTTHYLHCFIISWISKTRNIHSCSPFTTDQVTNLSQRTVLVLEWYRPYS